MPPRKRASSKEPSGPATVKRKAPSRTKATPSNATPSTPVIKQAPKRRGLRSAAADSSPVQVQDNPDRILRTRRAKATASQERNESEASSAAALDSTTEETTHDEHSEEEPIRITRKPERHFLRSAAHVPAAIAEAEVGSPVKPPKATGRKKKFTPSNDVYSHKAQEQIDLLHMLEKEKFERENTQNGDDDAVGESAGAVTQENDAQDQATSKSPRKTPVKTPSKTPSKVPVQPFEFTTPKTASWGLGSLFKRFLPSFSSPSSSPSQAVPATAPSKPTEMLSQEAQDELQTSLTPTRVPRRRVNNRQSRTKYRSSGSRLPPLKTTYQDRVIAKQTLKAINPDEKARAKQWFDETLQKLAANEGKPGDKRKRFESPIKIDELQKIPARAPWQSEGSFGLQADFFDDSDDEAEVPGWHWLQLRAETEEVASPAKRRKVTDTHGGSASLSDIHPRSSIVPSPLFHSPSQRYQGGNIFDADKSAKPSPDRSQKRVKPSGSFSVPDEDTDEEEETPAPLKTPTKGTPSSTPARAPTTPTSTKPQTPAPATPTEVGTNQQPWTQQPPPPPTPAHASLPGLSPVPPTPTPDDEMSAKIARIRNQATPYAPKRGSRLRNTVADSSPDSAGPDVNGAFSAASGTDLDSGLLTQPHVAGDSRGPGTSVSTPVARATTSATTPKLQQNAITSSDPFMTNGEPKRVEPKLPAAKPEKSVLLGPAPEFTDLDNGSELEGAVGNYIKTSGFTESSTETWKLAPGFSDLSEDDDNDDLFPDGSRSLTASELDAEVVTTNGV